jgi:hypothetical protein
MFGETIMRLINTKEITNQDRYTSILLIKLSINNLAD